MTFAVSQFRFCRDPLDFGSDVVYRNHRGKGFRAERGSGAGEIIADGITGGRWLRRRGQTPWYELTCHYNGKEYRAASGKRRNAIQRLVVNLNNGDYVGREWE